MPTNMEDIIILVWKSACFAIELVKGKFIVNDKQIDTVFRCNGPLQVVEENMGCKRCKVGIYVGEMVNIF